MRKQRRVVRRGIDYPSVLIGLSWLGLLAFWPRSVDSSAVEGTADQIRVVSFRAPADAPSLVQRPDLFAHAYGVSFALKENGLRELHLEDGISFVDPTFLLRIPSVAADVWPASSPASVRSFDTVAFTRGGGDVSLQKKPVGSPCVDVWLSPSLVKSGVRIRSMSEIEPVLGESSWEAEAELGFEADGSLQYVFVDKSTATDVATTALAYALHTACGSETGASLAGRVRISYCPK